MRKLPAVIVALSMTAVGLVGCTATSDAATACGRTTDASAPALAAISVDGETGSAPSVQVHTPFHTAKTVFEDVHTGDGAIAVTADDQVLSLDVTLVDGATGQPLAATGYDKSPTQPRSLSEWTGSFPAFGTALHCATAGTRVAVAIAPKDIDEQTRMTFGLSTDTSMVAVLDVNTVFRAAADGSPVYNSGWGMPAVVRAPGGRPGVIVPDAPAPSDLRVQLLKHGSGQTVSADDTVLLHYTLVDWSDKSVTHTTWDTKPGFVALSGESEGIQTAVTGQTVGSQVLAVIPPGKAGADTKDTQIAVVDILGVQDTPAP